MADPGALPAGPVPAAGAGAAFELWRAKGALVLGPLLFLLVLALPLEPALTPEAHRLAAVMVLVIAFWIGEPIPPAMTALLGPTLALLIGAVPGATAQEAVKNAYGRFGDPILMLFLGGFFIAEAMTVHGLDRRFAMRVLTLGPFGGSPRRIVIGLGLCSFLLSMWVSNTATTALLIPIALGMLKVARSQAGPDGAAQADRLDQACLLMLPFAATVGGLGTPVGTAPNIIGIAQISELAGVKVGFLAWMRLTLPLCAVMMVTLFLLLGRRLGGGLDLRTYAAEERARLGPWRRGEVVTAAAFGLAVTLWVTSGLSQAVPDDRWAAWELTGVLPRGLDGWFEGHLPEGAIGLVAASLLFLIPAAPGRPTLEWREAARIDWGTLMLLGGGLSLGELVKTTGLSAAIGQGVVTGLGVDSTWSLVIVSAGLAILLSEVTSNTATATLLVPVVIGIAQKAGLSPLPPALAATLGCSFGFMLPISTPPNALAYATGRIPISVMVREGVVFDAIGFVILVAGLFALWPLVGPV